MRELRCSASFRSSNTPKRARDDFSEARNSEYREPVANPRLAEVVSGLDPESAFQSQPSRVHDHTSESSTHSRCVSKGRSRRSARCAGWPCVSLVASTDHENQKSAKFEPVCKFFNSSGSGHDTAIWQAKGLYLSADGIRSRHSGSTHHKAA